MDAPKKKLNSTMHAWFKVQIVMLIFLPSVLLLQR